MRRWYIFVPVSTSGHWLIRLELGSGWDDSFRPEKCSKLGARERDMEHADEEQAIVIQ